MYVEGEALVEPGEKPGDLVAKSRDLLRGARQPVDTVHFEGEHQRVVAGPDHPVVDLERIGQMREEVWIARPEPRCPSIVGAEEACRIKHSGALSCARPVHAAYGGRPPSVRHGHWD